MNRLTQLMTLVVAFFGLIGYQTVTAHGGEDHGAATAPTGKAMTYFSSQAISDKYELVLHYDPLEAGEAGKLRLYINEFDTNRPVDGATLQISSPDDNKMTFTVKPIGKGIYELAGTFAAKKAYSLTVSLNAKPGADLLLLPGINVGTDLPVATAAEPITAHTHWYENTFVLLGGGLLLGMGLMFFLMRLRNRRVAVSIAILLGILPTANWQVAIAHGGDDRNAGPHGGGTAGGGATSSTFAIPKETQFLFNILTQRLQAGEQAQTTTVAGTVLPSSTGQAVVQSPQVGRLASLRVRVGQTVSKGQTLAVVEQTIDAATQINLQSERNTLTAELQAARKEYDRLKTIEDIVAKRDLTEAEARLNRAQANLKVFSGITRAGGNNARSISLKAPVGGIVGPFTVAIGTTVNVGETLFTVTNLGKVYIEAQVFDKDLPVLRSAKSFGVEGVNDAERGPAGKSGVARLLSQAQNINASNQSQRLLFEMDNAGGGFKIGEFVTIRVQSAKGTRGLSVPNSAISEMNGKSVVFIKDAPEVVSLAYVTTGADNGQFTQILTGVEADERVVVTGTYQAKMIYLNQ